MHSKVTLEEILSTANLSAESSEKRSPRLQVHQHGSTYTSTAARMLPQAKLQRSTHGLASAIREGCARARGLQSCSNLRQPATGGSSAQRFFPRRLVTQRTSRLSRKASSSSGVLKAFGRTSMGRKDRVELDGRGFLLCRETGCDQPLFLRLRELNPNAWRTCLNETPYQSSSSHP